MKLPKMSAGIVRGTGRAVQENAGVVPSGLLDDIGNPCKVQCRATQAVETAKCPRSGLAAAVCMGCD